MKIAIISDIHANLHALQAVADDLERVRPDHLVCLGDLVGYGAYPNEVIDWVREREMATVMGNYDEGVGFDLKDCGCVYRDPQDDRRGKQSLMWSREHTSPERKEYLCSLPMQIRQDLAGAHVLFVHGSPRKINEYLYQDRPAATFEHIAKVAGCDMLLFGHTHLPYQKWVGKTVFINAGSVGKPKDGDPRAGYVILEINRYRRVEFRRVTYDVAAAARGVRESGLPSLFADLLETGGVLPTSDSVVTALAAP
jgi:putative phosphoesterase